jgi:hypothetical protein
MVPQERPVIDSIEEAIEYCRQQEIADEKNWGLLYLIKIVVKRLMFNIMLFGNEVVWAFQRVVRKCHAADFDLSYIDYHITKVLLPKLEAFRKKSLPLSPADDEMKTWLNMLDEIIYAFRWNLYANWEKNRKDENYFYRYYFAEDDSKLNNINYHDSELVKKAAARAQKGFELFGKYFTGLWHYNKFK